MCMVPEGLNQNGRMKNHFTSSYLHILGNTHNSRLLLLPPRVGIFQFLSGHPVFLSVSSQRLLECFSKSCTNTVLPPRLYYILNAHFAKACQLDLGTLPITVNPGVPIATSFLHCIIVFHAGESKEDIRYYCISWCI